MIGEKKICPSCKLEFVTSRPRQTYCDHKHYKPCPVCGKMQYMKYPGDPAPACSKECRHVLRVLHKNGQKGKYEGSRAYIDPKTVPEIVHKSDYAIGTSDPMISKESQAQRPSLNKPVQLFKSKVNLSSQPRDKESQLCKTTDILVKSDAGQTSADTNFHIQSTFTYDENGLDNDHKAIFQSNHVVCGFVPGHNYDIHIERNTKNKYPVYVTTAYDEKGNKLELINSSWIMVQRYWNIMTS